MNSPLPPTCTQRRAVNNGLLVDLSNGMGAAEFPYRFLPAAECAGQKHQSLADHRLQLESGLVGDVEKGKLVNGVKSQG